MNLGSMSYSAKLKLCIVQGIVCSSQCEVYSIKCTVYSVKCTVYSVLYCMQCYDTLPAQVCMSKAWVEKIYSDLVYFPKACLNASYSS